jgi:hypothetical protein
MPMTTTRRVLCATAALAVGLGIAGCTSGKDKPGTFASTVPSTDTATALSKADFITKMNAVCAAIDQQRKALPTPSGLTDYPVIAQNLSGTLRILPSFISQADALVQRSPDKTALDTNWLDLEKADFAAVKPIAERMVADSTAKDSAKVAADGEALSSAPDHSSAIATYMTSYGLTSCATLESS